MKKVFLDTNVLLDFFDSTRANHIEAKNLILYLLSNNITIVFSEDMISTIAYILKKNSLVLNNFLSFLKDVTLRNNFVIASFGLSVVNTACNYFEINNGDFEDCLQYFCAEKENCEAIFSMDSTFPNIRIPVMKYGQVSGGGGRISL